MGQTGFSADIGALPRWNRNCPRTKGSEAGEQASWISHNMSSKPSAKMRSSSSSGESTRTTPIRHQFSCLLRLRCNRRRRPWSYYSPVLCGEGNPTIVRYRACRAFRQCGSAILGSISQAGAILNQTLTRPYLAFRSCRPSELVVPTRENLTHALLSAVYNALIFKGENWG
jgi:hypothetical protein